MKSQMSKAGDAETQAMFAVMETIVGAPLHGAIVLFQVAPDSGVEGLDPRTEGLFGIVRGEPGDEAAFHPLDEGTILNVVAEFFERQFGGDDASPAG